MTKEPVKPNEKVTKNEFYKKAFGVVWSILLFLILMIFNESKDYLKSMDSKYNSMQTSMVKIEQISNNLSAQNKDQETRLRKLEKSSMYSDYINRRNNDREKL